MGLGFTLALIVIGGVREIIGSGTFFGVELFFGLYEPALLAILAPGGFITLGILMGVFRQFQLRKEAKTAPAAACAYDGWKNLSACAGCAMAAACRKAEKAAAEAKKEGDEQ